MLILSRKPGQSIVIGGIIEITVAEVRGDQVRLGITAPRSVPVFRTEVLVQQGRPCPNGPDPENLMELLTQAAAQPAPTETEATKESSLPPGLTEQ